MCCPMRRTLICKAVLYVVSYLIVGCSCPNFQLNTLPILPLVFHNSLDLTVASVPKFILPYTLLLIEPLLSDCFFYILLSFRSGFLCFALLCEFPPNKVRSFLPPGQAFLTVPSLTSFPPPFPKSYCTSFFLPKSGSRIIFLSLSSLLSRVPQCLASSSVVGPLEPVPSPHRIKFPFSFSIVLFSNIPPPHGMPADSFFSFVKADFSSILLIPHTTG